MNIAGFIIGIIIGLFAGYQLGVWHGIMRLGKAERKARLGRIGWPYKRQD